MDKLIGLEVNHNEMEQISQSLGDNGFIEICWVKSEGSRRGHYIIKDVGYDE